MYDYCSGFLAAGRFNVLNKKKCCVVVTTRRKFRVDRVIRVRPSDHRDQLPLP